MTNRTVWKLLGGVGIVTLIGGVTIGPILRAQTQDDVRFEVASVRRVEIPDVPAGVPVFPTTGGIGTSDPRHIAYHGTWITSLIVQAYGVRAEKITGGPDWLAKTRYDIIANIPEGTTKEQFNRMLANLLRDRFKLRFHTEKKDQPVYVLHVGKNGPKFKETARVGGNATGSSTPVGATLDSEGFPVLSPDTKGVIGLPGSDGMFLVGQDATIAQMMGMIETKAGRPIIDETGLTGHYDFKIHFEWISRGPATAPSSAPSVFTAVEEQLGLKLESGTHSFDRIVIDSIDREPTEN
jgi:uncharacterized protein (TIGR03435 family)